MRDDLVAYFESHHKLVEADALQLLLGAAQPLQLSRQLIEEAGPEVPFVTVEMVEQMLAHASARRGPIARYPSAPDLLSRSESGASPPDFQLVSEGFEPPTGNLAPLAAYEGLFASRYRTLSRMLRGRPDLDNVRPIAELRGAEGSASVLGMVRDVRQTAEKHHLIVRLEDETGVLEVLIPHDTPAAHTTFLNDEVVGAHLHLPRERGKIPRVLSVHRPDVPSQRPTRRRTSAGRVVFLSDLHIGSRSFLTEAWGRLVEFLSGKGTRPEVAREIRHVVIAGDLVDGIGVYPNQEKDLAIRDIIEQYRELGRRLSELPDRLNVVVVPGNHDAVCPAEPQPALSPELASSLPANVHSLANPSTFALEGVVIEAYHGRSFDDLIPAIPGASYAHPTDVMKRMLAMRHLAPIYGGRTPLAPLARDGLVIDPAPDILVTGHAHTYGVDQHRGVLLLNASTWQAETEYQRMRNLTPVPARTAVVSLTDLSLETFDFSDESAETGSSSA